MTSMDKAAIAISIAIAAIGVGIAFSGSTLNSADIGQPAIQTNPGIEDTMMMDDDAMMEDTMMMDDDAMMEDTMVMDDDMMVAEDKMMKDDDAMMMDDTMMMDDDKMMKDDDAMMMDDGKQQGSTSVPTTHAVEIPVGSLLPGCEETNECYLPPQLSIYVGDTVEWDNVDTAAHTVTAGSIAETTGEFDSSLILAGATYSFTFEEAGDYDYFCIVHPWMAGSISVS